jgi:hypothetical protein
VKPPKRRRYDVEPLKGIKPAFTKDDVSSHVEPCPDKPHADETKAQQEVLEQSVDFPDKTFILKEIENLNEQLNQLTDIIKRLTEFRLTYDEYMQYVELMRNQSEQGIKQLEQQIDNTTIATLQQALESLQVYLMKFKIMDEEANLLVDPQNLFNQHQKLEYDLTMLIERY